jgi:hypothetical protein
MSAMGGAIWRKSSIYAGCVGMILGSPTRAFFLPPSIYSYRGFMIIDRVLIDFINWFPRLLRGNLVGQSWFLNTTFYALSPLGVDSNIF